jgi:heavy metal translocating P-type ATPase
MPKTIARRKTNGIGRLNRWRVCSDTPGRIRAANPVLAQWSAARPRVESELLGINGIISFDVNLVTARVLVRFESRRVRSEAVLEALARATANLETTNADPLPTSDRAPSGASLHLYASTLNAAFVVGTIGMPALLPFRIAATTVVAAHLIVSGLRAIIFERKLRVDVLDALVITMLLVFKVPVASALMTWVVDFCAVLLESTADMSRKLLTSLFGAQVARAWVLIDGVEVEMSIDNVAPGALIVVRAGEQVPVDGTIAEGEALIDQHALTGEFVPVERGPEERVFSMTIVLAGRIIVRAEQVGRATQAAKIVEYINRSLEHKVRAQTETERFADRMVAPTLLLGAVGGLRGRSTAAAIINADYGTGVRIAGPLALLASLARAANRGMVIKDGAVLERLTEVTAVIFDKTGTLTEDTPVVSRVISMDDKFSPDELLAVVAAAERRFAHPIARAIVAHAAERGLELPDVADHTHHIGAGVAVRIGRRQIRIGSRRFLEHEGVRVGEDVETHIRRIEEAGRTAVYVAGGKRVIGLVEIKASERPEAQRIVTRLHERNIEVHLLSGDHNVATRTLAESLGIEHYAAEVLPQHKADYVRELQQKGHVVAMIGDGINDSVALSVADVSISLRGASDIATDVANVIMMSGDLARLDELWTLAESLDSNINRSVRMVLWSNTAVIVGALAGVFGLAVSIVLNNGVNLLATLNGFLPYYSVVIASRPTAIGTDLAEEQPSL